jgi:hypothetical protein
MGMTHPVPQIFPEKPFYKALFKSNYGQVTIISSGLQGKKPPYLFSKISQFSDFFRQIPIAGVAYPASVELAC